MLETDPSDVILQAETYLVDRSGSDGHHGGLQHFALRFLRQHDAPFRHRLCCEALHQHPVKQGEEFPEGLKKENISVWSLEICCNNTEGPLGGHKLI